MELIISLTIVLFSAILHEIAHGFVAEKLGDPTPRLMGRLTLDPRPHIDPMMSIAIPLLMAISGSPVIIGGAKPVPVDPFNFRDKRKDVALVALAGPLTNICLASLAAILIHVLTFANPPGLLIALFDIIITINLSLAFFNLLPIPPLDGSKLFSLFLPEKEALAYLSIGNIGIFILFFLLAFPIGPFSLGSFLWTLITFSRTILGV